MQQTKKENTLTSKGTKKGSKQTSAQAKERKHANKEASREKACEEANKQAHVQASKQRERVSSREKCVFGYSVHRSITLDYGRPTCQQAWLQERDSRCIKTSMNPHGIYEAMLEDTNNKQRHMNEQ